MLWGYVAVSVVSMAAGAAVCYFRFKLKGMLITAAEALERKAKTL